MSDTVVTVESHGDGGNTKTPSIRARGWSFTLNNYTEEEYKTISDWTQKHSKKYIIGKEIGAQGTPHLQGYLYVQNTAKLSTLKGLLTRAHWERSRGNPEQNYKYCSKDNDFICGGFEKPITLQEAIKTKLLKKYESVKWKDWQQKILDLVNKEADDRTINWVVDFEGNSGKSFLTKYLALTREVIIADGKKDNIFNQVNIKLNEQQKEFEIVLLDIPRHMEGYVNYGVLEQLKNGLIYSGKYEGGVCLFDNVHVIVFANFAPDLTQFSQDRWNIISI